MKKYSSELSKAYDESLDELDEMDDEDFDAEKEPVLIDDEETLDDSSEEKKLD
jgi:hypothetical protein